MVLGSTEAIERAVGASMGARQYAGRFVASCVGEIGSTPEQWIFSSIYDVHRLLYP